MLQSFFVTVLGAVVVFDFVIVGVVVFTVGNMNINLIFLR